MAKGETLKSWALLIMGAVSPFLFSSTLPSTVVMAALCLTVLLALAGKAGVRLFCLFPLAFLAVTLVLHQRVSGRYQASSESLPVQLSGVIGNLPETTVNGLRFMFLPDAGQPGAGRKVQVYWYRNRHAGKTRGNDLPHLRAGEHWRLQLRLRPARGRVNFHGVDAERWYFTEGLYALALVQDGNNARLSGPGWLNLQHWRERVLDQLARVAGDKPAFPVLAALAVADRRGLTRHDRTILSATGTGHLLAISGLHIGLAAVLGFYLGRIVLSCLLASLQHRLAIVLPWLSAWLAALSYAALAGFGVSTQRALIMLTVACVAVLSRRNIHPGQGWLIAMVLVLLVDPVAPLRAGFWFSFIAVAVLLMLFIPRFGHMAIWRRMLLAQLGISLVMAPLGMYWFQQASLPGLLANLVAIPAVSMLIVPAILAGMLLLWLPGPLAGFMTGVAAHAAQWLMVVLEWISVLQPPALSSTRAPGLFTVLLAMLGASLLLLPRGLPGRAAGLLLMLPLFLPAHPDRGKSQVRIDFLDVGQGLSVLLNSAKHLAVYDTGPGNGLKGEDGLDMVEGTIQPMIAATGRKPDMVIASHADLDHSGGLESLMSEYPGAEYLASLPGRSPGIRPCQAPRRWVWDGLDFEVLHPSPGLPYLGNDSSCVLSVRGPSISLLLTGDISHVVERRLAERGLGAYTVLVAPHHGSSTSSSQVLIDAAKPRWAIISAAQGNRFDFPRADVLERFSKAAVATLNTARCGGIRMIAGARGAPVVQSARVTRKAIWRWPAGGECP
jgi:competence protein ComEC